MRALTAAVFCLTCATAFCGIAFGLRVPLEFLLMIGCLAFMLLILEREEELEMKGGNPQDQQ